MQRNTHTILIINVEGYSWAFFPLLLLFLCAWPPFQTNLIYGQISILITLFVIAGWYSLRKDKVIISGIFIALATMLKFYSGLLIFYFLINKKWKALLSSIVSTCIILLITLLVSRHDIFHFFLQILPSDVKYFEFITQNYAINGFFAKLFLSVKAYYSGGVYTATENYIYKNIFLWLSFALLIIYTMFSVRKYNYNNDLGLSIFIILSLLLSPICWYHFLTLLLLPFVVIAKQLLKKRTISEVVIFLIALFLISIDTSSVYFLKALYIVRGIIPGNPESFFYRMTFYSLPFYGMVLLLFLNFRMIKKYNKAVTEKAF